MMITLGPSQVYVLPWPRCPAHGQMQRQQDSGDWTCAGFDGEGCDEQVSDREWQAHPQHAGTMDPITLHIG